MTILRVQNYVPSVVQENPLLVEARVLLTLTEFKIALSTWLILDICIDTLSH